MTDRLRCQVCIDRPELRHLDPHLVSVSLRRCDTCLGVLASEQSIASAPDHYHDKHYVMAEGHGRHRCRACDVLFDGARELCEKCGAPQAIVCAQCEKEMAFVRVAGTTVDVCWRCRMVWFDRGELGFLTRRHGRELKQRLSSPPGGSVALGAVVPNVLDVPFTPDGALIAGQAAVEVAAHGVSAAIEHAPSSVVAAGEVAVNAGEAAIELSSGAVDVLLDVVGSLFDF